MLISLFMFKDEQEKVEIDLNAKEPKKLESGELILPYSKKKCGIRVDNVSHTSSDKWTLLAKTIPDDSTILDSVMVQVHQQPKLNFQTIFKHELGTASIKCSNTKISNEPTYCKMYNEKNKILLNSCKESLSIVVRNKTSIKCNTLTWAVFSQSKETILIEPIIKNVNVAKGNLTENNDYIIMNCQLSGLTGPCKAEYPDGLKSVFITDGLLSGRLSTLDTSISTGKCVLEIKKPLQSDEIGIWTISREDQGRSTGCMFYAGDDQTKLIKKAVEKIEPMQYREIINKTQTFDIKCKAPFPLEICYLVDPNNVIHFPDNFRFDKSKTMGYCDFTMKVAPGEYICGLSNINLYKDEIRYKHIVHVVEDIGEVVTPLAKVDLGQTIQLLCRIPFDVISHCAFIDPMRNVYYISNYFKQRKDSRITYYGNGLEQGHCGIRIENIIEDDIGNWKCQIKSGYNRHSSFDIQIELLYRLSEASTIGLAVGAVVILGTFLISAGYLYRRKQILSRENSANETLEMAGRSNNEDRHTRRESEESFTSKES
ncbi:uncharacterized protein LOC129605644 [Condylostylus longicornis]|uniref:uncharacterized protein LOC129605644 n=1 Tax=Condylostylus longicornis TaxID=2530218 RepID=UPI00244E48D1|nr:uncharacterized protein LOC129605644 [Condylostylus longicornis]